MYILIGLIVLIAAKFIFGLGILLLTIIAVGFLICHAISDSNNEDEVDYSELY